MSQVYTGATVVINEMGDVKAMAELVGSVTYETLQELNKGRPLSITQDQYELFIARLGREFIDAGLLDEELVPTGSFKLAA